MSRFRVRVFRGRRRLAVAGITVTCAVATAASLFATTAAAPPAAAAGPTGQVRSQIQTLLDTYLQAQGVNGISLAVVTPSSSGRRVDTTYFTSGVLTAGSPRRVDTSTQFEIASETKTFTSALLARLVADGRVKLDDPVQKYAPAGVTVPSWTENGTSYPMRLRDLATHQSALPDMPPNFQDACAPDQNCWQLFTTDKLWDAVHKYQPKWKPGTNWLYSNFGFGLLGTILANVLYPGQQPPAYEKALQSLFLQDLKMSSTILGGPTPRMATPYYQNGQVAPLLLDTNALAGGGGLVSDIRDMSTWTAASLGFDTGSGDAAGKSVAQTVQPLSKITTICNNTQLDSCHPATFSMGMAWQLYTASDSSVGVPWAFKNGESNGMKSVTVLAPSERVGVTLLSNAANQALDNDLGVTLLRLVLASRK